MSFCESLKAKFPIVDFAPVWGGAGSVRNCGAGVWVGGSVLQNYAIDRWSGVEMY